MQDNKPTANEHQHGGDHYRGEYQHWDWALNNGLCYFTGCATKYVSRWRKKNGLEDLRKAQHYVQKLTEVEFPPSCLALVVDVAARKRVEFRKKTGFAGQRDLHEFCMANQIDDLNEMAILNLLANWRSWRDLEYASELIERLIHEEEVKP